MQDVHDGVQTEGELKQGVMLRATGASLSLIHHALFHRVYLKVLQINKLAENTNVSLQSCRNKTEKLTALAQSVCLS